MHPGYTKPNTMTILKTPIKPGRNQDQERASLAGKPTHRTDISRQPPWPQLLLLLPPLSPPPFFSLPRLHDYDSIQHKHSHFHHYHTLSHWFRSSSESSVLDTALDLFLVPLKVLSGLEICANLIWHFPLILGWVWIFLVFGFFFLSSLLTLS